MFEVKTGNVNMFLAVISLRVLSPLKTISLESLQGSFQIVQSKNCLHKSNYYIYCK